MKNPTSVGSLFPSSSALVNKILRKIPKNPTSRAPYRILEIGPGTGAFTEKLVQRLDANDHLDLVEYNPEFCQILYKKFGHLSNVTIHQSCIMQFRSQEPYDIVISGLPLTLFDKDFVGEIVQKYEHLTKPGGWLSYFEYTIIPDVKMLILNILNIDSDFNAVLAHKKNFKNKAAQIEIDPVWRSIPPAQVIHCQMSALTQ